MKTSNSLLAALISIALISIARSSSALAQSPSLLDVAANQTKGDGTENGEPGVGSADSGGTVLLVPVDIQKAFQTKDPALDLFTQAALAAGYTQQVIDLTVPRLRESHELAFIWRNKRGLPRTYAELVKAGDVGPFHLDPRPLDLVARQLTWHLDQLTIVSILNKTTAEQALTSDDPTFASASDEGLRKLYAAISSLTQMTLQHYSAENPNQLVANFEKQAARMLKLYNGMPVATELAPTLDYLRDQLRAGTSPVAKSATPAAVLGTLAALSGKDKALISTARIDQLPLDVENALTTRGIPDENRFAVGHVVERLLEMRRLSGTPSFALAKADFDRALKDPKFLAVASPAEVAFYKKTAASFAARSNAVAHNAAIKAVPFEATPGADPGIGNHPPDPRQCVVLGTAIAWNATIPGITGAYIELNGKRYFALGVTLPAAGFTKQALVITGLPGTKPEDVLTGVSVAIDGTKAGVAGASVAANSKGYLAGVSLGLSVGSPFNVTITDTQEIGKKVPVVEQARQAYEDVTIGTILLKGFPDRTITMVRRDIAEHPVSTNGQVKGLLDYLDNKLQPYLSDRWPSSPEHAELQRLIESKSGAAELDRTEGWTKIGERMQELALKFFDRVDPRKTKDS